MTPDLRIQPHANRGEGNLAGIGGPPSTHELHGRVDAGPHLKLGQVERERAAGNLHCGARAPRAIRVRHARDVILGESRREGDGPRRVIHMVIGGQELAGAVQAHRERSRHDGPMRELVGTLAPIPPDQVGGRVALHLGDLTAEPGTQRRACRNRGCDDQAHSDQAPRPLPKRAPYPMHPLPKHRSQETPQPSPKPIALLLEG